MSFSYMVLGAGRQGIAAAYDLVKFGEAKRVTLADVDATLAERSAAQVNELLGRRAATALALDVSDEAAVRRAQRRALLLQPGPDARRDCQRRVVLRPGRQHRYGPPAACAGWRSAPRRG